MKVVGLHGQHGHEGIDYGEPVEVTEDGDRLLAVEGGMCMAVRGIKGDWVHPLCAAKVKVEE